MTLTPEGGGSQTHRAGKQAEQAAVRRDDVVGALAWQLSFQRRKLSTWSVPCTSLSMAREFGAEQAAATLGGLFVCFCLTTELVYTVRTALLCHVCKHTS